MATFYHLFSVFKPPSLERTKKLTAVCAKITITRLLGYLFFCGYETAVGFLVVDFFSSQKYIFYFYQGKLFDMWLEALFIVKKAVPFTPL